MNTETRYMQNLCFRLKVQGMSQKEIAKETGLKHTEVARHLSNHASRAFGAEMLGGIISSGDIKANSFINTETFSKAQLPNIELSDTLKKESDFFKIPDGRDGELYLYKNADKQREKVSEYIENKYKGKRIKVLYMADLHIPFTVYDLVKHILKEHSDSDILVLNGDILDLFNVSTFAKDKTVALKRELQEGREFIELVSKLFKDIILIEGNHERRLRNYIKNVIPVDLHFLFPQDVLEVMQQGTVLKKEPLDNVHVVGSWWVKLFDTIYAHPDNYSNGAMKTAVLTTEHFKLVKNIPHRALIIGHTHQAGKIIDRGTMLMETGCLQHDVDYKHGSKFIKTTWTRAHAVFYYDENGNIQFNESNVIVYPI